MLKNGLPIHDNSFHVTAHQKGVIDDLQILRGWAILFVLFWHLQMNKATRPIVPEEFSAWLRFNTGVDLFFAISGFVIARSFLPVFYATPRIKKRFSIVSEFWIRRAFRLFPSAWSWAISIIIGGFVFSTSTRWGVFEDNLKGALSVFFHYANYFASQNQWNTGPFNIYWSLSLEEQFYICLPLLGLATGRPIGLAISLIIAIGVRLWNPLPIMAIWYRYEGMALGVLLAMAQMYLAPYYARLEPKFLSAPALRLFTFITLVAGMVLCASPKTAKLLGVNFLDLHFLVAVFAILIVFIASFDRDYLAPPGILKSLMLWIGARSYALYLCHIIVLFFVVDGMTFMGLYHNDSTAARMLVVCVSIPLMFWLADQNFKIIEQPLNAYGKKLTKRLSTTSDHVSHSEQQKRLVK